LQAKTFTKKGKEREEKMDRKFLKSESAVSEVIGFILIFSIVMLAISAIYAVGYPTIQSSKENAQFQNMEQSFMVLQSNINTVAFGQAPVRTLKTSLGGGSLTVYPDAGWINVSTTGTVYSCDVNIGAIEYEKNGRSIAYEGGGVWEKYPAGAAIKVSKPRIFVHGDDGNRTVSVSIINISSENGISSVGGEGAASVVVRFHSTSSPYINSTSAPENVTIVVTSDYADAWERYFDDIKKAGDDVNTTGANEVTAIIRYDTLVVNEHVIEVEVS